MTYEEWLLLVEYALLEYELNINDVPDWMLNDAFNRGVSPWDIKAEDVIWQVLQK